MDEKQLEKRITESADRMRKYGDLLRSRNELIKVNNLLPSPDISVEIWVAGEWVRLTPTTEGESVAVSVLLKAALTKVTTDLEKTAKKLEHI